MSAWQKNMKMHQHYLKTSTAAETGTGTDSEQEMTTMFNLFSFCSTITWTDRDRCYFCRGIVNIGRRLDVDFKKIR